MKAREKDASSTQKKRRRKNSSLSRETDMHKAWSERTVRKKKKDRHASWRDGVVEGSCFQPQGSAELHV